MGFWMKSETPLLYNQLEQREEQLDAEILRQAVVGFQTVKALWMQGKEKAC